jgi:hypothetical protein
MLHTVSRYYERIQTKAEMYQSSEGLYRHTLNFLMLRGALLTTAAWISLGVKMAQQWQSL